MSQRGRGVSIIERPFFLDFIAIFVKTAVEYKRIA